METRDDFVDEFFAEEKPLRHKGMPLLIPRDPEMRTREDGRLAYTRASSLADYLEEFSYLWKWKMRGLAKGLADSMDLVRLVAAEDYTTGFALNEVANRQAGKRIDEVIERALDRSGTSMKADYGTAIHSRTEPGNGGVDPDEKQRADVAATWQLWADLGVKHLGTEIFTANDLVRSAGTFDNLSYVPGLGIIVTDKKTSAKAKSTYDVQLGVYSEADVYDAETDERMTLEEYVESLGWNPALLNRDVGVVWWIKDGKCEARELDLKNGRKWAWIAAKIRDERRSQGVAKNITRTLLSKSVKYRSELLDMIQHSDEAGLQDLWDDLAIRAVWTDEHTTAAKARKAELA